MKKSLCFLFLLLFFKMQVFAQSPKISFEHLNMRNGLASEYVGDILQDEKGYIWLNNASSVTRYDGYHFKTYDLKIKGDVNPMNSYSYNMIWDKKKTLFAGTLGGNIFRYDPMLDSLVLEKKGPNKTGEGLFFPFTFVDRDNNLWSFGFKSEKEFSFEIYDRVKKHVRKLGRTLKGKDFFGAEQMRTYYQSPAGDILIGASNGFYNYDFKEKRFIGYLTAKDSVNSLNVTGLYQETEGARDIWLLANKWKDNQVMLYRYNLETKLLKPCLNIPGKAINGDPSIFQDKKGRIWLQSNAGLFLYDKASNQKKDYLYPVTDKHAKDQNVRDVLVDRENVFWVSTDFGLLKFDPATGQFQRYMANQSDPYALGHIHVVKVFEDRSGLKWVGMDEYGVDRITNLHTAFTGVKNNPDIPGSYPENTTGIALRPDGNYWVTSQSGLFEWNVKKNIFTQVIPPTKKENGYCQFPFILPGGVLVYGDDGLNIYNPADKKVQTIVIPDKAGLAKAYKDNKSNIWVLTRKGRFYKLNLEKASLERYPYVNQSGLAAKADSVTDLASAEIYEDQAGALWLATSKSGLCKVDQVKKHIIISSELQGKVLNDISQMYSNKAGHLWLGTNYNGFWEFDKRSNKLIRQVKDDQGVLKGEIRGIAEDRSGNIWITSQRGLAKYNDQSGIVLDYTVGNNIPLEVPVRLLTLPDGRFVLCMFNSLLTFNPDDIKSNRVAPQVQVERVVFSDPKNTEKGEHLINALNSNHATLEYNQNRVTFNYVALHYVNSSQNKYAYMLEGYDKDWIQAQTQRSVTYNNLAPATYTFRIKASNSDGVWNNKGVSYMITINTPWWSRWWAWVLYVLAFGSAIYGFIYYRSRQLIHRNKLLEQKISLRTSQLSEANEELQAKQEEITSQRDQLAEAFDDLKITQTQLVQSEKMASLGELTAGIAHEIQNPLNFVNNFSEVSIELLDEMEVDLNADKKENAIEIASDIRQNLEKISHHGKRADAIVKNMLQHSRNSNAERQLTNVNALADEYLRLAYHGLRAKNKNFNADLVTNFEKEMPPINILGQDIGRVLLNLYNNAFYAVQQKQLSAPSDYKPVIEINTSVKDNTVLIKVKDNGIGIPDAIKQKIMQPFFTTKPTGEGTGLGLSLSYDIVVKGHGGNIELNSKEGSGSEFIVSLPLA